MEGEKPKTEKEMEIELLRKISDTMSAINSAKRVDDIVCALHSLAVLIFPVNTHLLSGVISERYKDKLFNVEIPSVQERHNQWQAFYQGTAFPALSRLLLYDVASDWLSCFPLSARKLVYDVFFANGLTSEVVLAVIPCLEHSGGDGHDANAVRSNAERLLELCLLENDGVSKMAREFSAYHVSKDFNSALLKPDLSRVAQLVASIPDKTRLKAPKSLSSHLFFKEITIQLLTAAEGENKEICDKSVISHRMEGDGTILFIAELFARICRRGSADLLISEVITRILRCLRSFLLPKRESLSKDAFMSEPSFRFWFMIMELIVDQYAVERMADQVLRQLACEHASDAEAYWSLWILFHRLLEHQSSMRFLFVEKFVLWKVFPFCCLRWILQFSVLERPPDAVMLTKGEKNSRLLDTVQHLVEVWAKQEFVQSAPIEQQAYITAALGLLLEKMSREELESTKDVMRSILEGVSCRLQYPSDLVRRMASSIALAFSIVIDPKNPLYLDDNCTSEVIDWEFGLVTPKEGTLPTTNGTTKGMDNMASLMTAEQVKELDHTVGNEAGSKGKVKSKKLFQFKLVDPDEIVDPATFNDDPVSEEEQDDNASEDSETSTDPSLQPYDLSDDDSDLKGRFTQLVDVVGALRKSDDPDGVERALDVAENLVRASADELQHVAPDLVRTLVQVRCSDAALQGEEESAEEKRQKALVALLVTCPFESLDSVNKLLYSPHVDVSQRIMILDVMTNAAQELANTKTVNRKYQLRPLISSAAETQPWFFPSNKGPHGAGSWKEISDKETPLNWSYRYERELPSKPGQIKKGKTRRWSLRPMNMLASEMETSLNKFPLYAAAFMLPAMHGFDKRRHGVDLLGRDFIVLGKLIHMLGVCMKCTALHPEASALAPHLLDMLSSREICHHKEAYVRRSVLFAASSILMALHPSYVVSALIEGNQEIARGLEWIRTWALHVAESDIDRDCYTLAMACLQLHAEMALQASRALESTETTSQAKSIGIPPNMSKGAIKIPGSSSSFLS